MPPKSPSRGRLHAASAAIALPRFGEPRPLTFSWIRHWEMLWAWYIVSVIWVWRIESLHGATRRSIFVFDRWRMIYDGCRIHGDSQTYFSWRDFWTLDEDDVWWTTDEGHMENGFRRSQFVCVCLHLCLHRITLTDQLLHGAIFFP